MKKAFFLNSCFFLGGSYGLWEAISFRENQEILSQRAQNAYIALKQEYSQYKEDLKFLMSNKDTLSFLRQKGWFSPCSRLLASSYLETLAPRFEDFSYKFNPQQTTLISDIYFKTTSVYIDIRAFLDVDIYSSLENILKKFPGILRTEEISLTRSPEDPQEIIGHLIFDWVTVNENASVSSTH